MPGSSQVPVVFATDEDVFVEAGSDWQTLVPNSNRVAAGSDGAFAAGNRWLLTSASNDFVAQGVTAGMVVMLSGPTTTPATAGAFKPPQYLAVDAASADGLLLRRCGLLSGKGLPPGPVAGLAGVIFEIKTLAPQIETTAYKLYEQYAIDPLVEFIGPTQIYDPRVFRRLTAMRVLYLLYMAQSRTDDKGDFAAKLHHYEAEYDKELETAVLRWAPATSNAPEITRFSMRLVR